MPRQPEPGQPGTTDQRPRWEGPPENRPRGYLPAEDDPTVERDAAGENLADPDRSTLSDAFTTGSNPPSSEEEVERTRRRAFAMWERDGRPEGSPDAYWYQAERDLREPVTAQALAVRTGLNIDEAQDLIDRLGADWELLEQAASSRADRQ